MYMLLLVLAINLIACNNNTKDRTTEIDQKAKQDSIKNASFFTVSGRLSIGYDSIANSQILLYDMKDTTIINELKDSDRFYFKLKFDKTYLAYFSKPGYYTKQVFIDTHAPDTLSFNYPPLTFMINLFEVDSKNKEKPSELVGKVYYNPKIDNFDTEIFVN